jgi:hypothetical protein
LAGLIWKLAQISEMTAIQQLPADAQDAITTRLLNEVDDEQAWSACFAATTDARLWPF